MVSKQQCVTNPVSCQILSNCTTERLCSERSIKSVLSNVNLGYIDKHDYLIREL